MGGFYEQNMDLLLAGTGGLLMKLDKLADLTVSETKAQTSLKAELHQWLPPHILKESAQESARAKPPMDSRQSGPDLHPH